MGKMKKIIAPAFCLSIVLILLMVSINVRAQEDPPGDWQKDWAVQKGFALSVDTAGYHMPTEIVFVPKPGPGPKDVLYYVTELRGKIKAVTNDRSVITFAEGFADLEPKAELPENQGQTGLAAVCLDPKHGYVFATYAYQDVQHILRNNIIRFETQPEVFATQPVAQVEFTDVFAAAESALSHQIGACQVDQDVLYVSVGDGGRPPLSQDTHYLNGKILRMTLDGKPFADNPFYDPEQENQPANFVWAFGLRNPFGLKVVDGKLYAAESGLQIDRFIRIEKGKNYLWDGSDRSMTTNAEVVFSPGVAPVHLDYLPAEASIFPAASRPAFFIALTGNARANQGKDPGIITFNYDVSKDTVTKAPDFLLRYTGSDFQMVTGIAVGPDGLYFVPLFPSVNGQVLKVTYDPENSYPNTLKRELNGMELIRAYGCLGCHSLENDPGFNAGGIIGPNLDPISLADRLRKRLNSPQYISTLQALDRLNFPPYSDYREARQEVVAATGDEKIQKWLVYHIEEPKFDNDRALMPNLNVTQEDAQIITNYLLVRADEQTLLKRILSRVQRSQDLILAFGAGFVLAALLAGVAYAWMRIRSRQTKLG